MATYNKRGYKAPKPESAEVTEKEPLEPVIDDSNSTTASVFNTLDEKATGLEEWVAKNQKIIYGVVLGIALLAVLYVVYDKFIHEPAENTAANDMFQAQEYFMQAVDAPAASDSLYNLALNGGEGKLGFLGIIETHGGTDAANLAHYHAGMAYLNMGKYKEALTHLSEFKTKDDILNAMALGATGDAFAQLNQNDDALEYYNKAISASDNDLTTPRFLFKAGQLALTMNKKEEALKHFNQIKEKYEGSAQGVNIEAYIARAQ
jgi:tetratricopeptide (TPR) repeat protein